MSERITETITFHFDNQEQQRLFHERLKSAPTGQAEPVALTSGDDWESDFERDEDGGVPIYSLDGTYVVADADSPEIARLIVDAVNLYRRHPTPPDGYRVPGGLIDLVDTLLMQAVAGPSPAWMMIPRTEYEQAAERFRAMLSASPTRKGT